MDKYFRAGPLYIILAAFLWGTTGTSQALAPPGASPIVVGAMRLVLGGGVLLLIALLRGSFTGYKSWPRGMTFLAAINIALYQLLFFSGVAATGVAVGTLVAIGSSPIFAGLLGWGIRKERLAWTWFLATLLAILGCAMLVTRQGDVQFTIGGLLFALGAGASYALYALATKELLEDHHPDAVMAVIFGLGAVFLSPVLFLGELDWILEIRGALVVTHLGVIATAVAYILFARGLQCVYVARAVTLSLTEPLTAAVLGILVLGERLSTNASIGLLFLFVGLVIVTLGGTPKNPPSKTPY